MQHVRVWFRPELIEHVPDEMPGNGAWAEVAMAFVKDGSLCMIPAGGNVHVSRAEQEVSIPLTSLLGYEVDRTGRRPG